MEKSVFTAEYGVFLGLLRAARKASGLTQMQLAERLGEPQSWVSKCERGEHRLDVVELWKYCQAIDAPFPELTQRLHDALLEVRLDQRTK